MFSLISHIDFQILHSSLFLLYLFLELLLLAQNGGDVELDVHIGIFWHGLGCDLLFQFFDIRFLDFLFDSGQIGRPLGRFELKLILFLVVIVEFLYVVLDFLPAFLLLLIDGLQIFRSLGRRVGLECGLYLLKFRHELRFRLGQIKLLDNGGPLLILDILDILHGIADAALNLLPRSTLTNLTDKFIALLLPLIQLRKQLVLQIVQFQMFLPQGEHACTQLLQVKNKTK